MFENSRPMDKGKIIIAILVIFLGGSLFFNVYLALPRGTPEHKKEVALKFGSMYIAADVDPQFGWDTAAFDFSLQIWEGLFANDLSDPSFKLIPQSSIFPYFFLFMIFFSINLFIELWTSL